MLFSSRSHRERLVAEPLSVRLFYSNPHQVLDILSVKDPYGAKRKKITPAEGEGEGRKTPDTPSSGEQDLPSRDKPQTKKLRVDRTSS